MTDLVPLLVFSAIMLLLSIGAFRRAKPMSAVNWMEAVLGFVGWFVLNTLLWVAILRNEPGTLFLNPVRLLPLLANLIAIPVLRSTRRRVLLGVGVAILVNALGMLVFTSPGPIVDQRFGHVLGMRPFFLSVFLPTP